LFAGCNRILTSGGYATAMEGAEKLTSLIKMAGGRISIMPGAGVASHNIAELAERTNANEFHASAKEVCPSLMKYRNDRVPMSSNAIMDEYSAIFSSKEKVAAIVEKLTSL